MHKKRMESAAGLAASLTQFYATAFTQPAKALTHSLAAGERVLKSLGGKSGSSRTRATSGSAIPSGVRIRPTRC